MKFDLSHIEFSHYDIKRGIKLPEKPSEELAEFIGIVLGDGHLHKKENCITITGSLFDIYYYNETVIPLIKSLFNIAPSLKRRNDRNSYYLFFNSQAIMCFLHKTLDMCRGNKINAKIPNFIYANRNFVKCFLRGLFDTDGCLKFSKQSKLLNYYPRIELGFKESKFVWKVLELIKILDFNYSIYFHKKANVVRFQISGKDNLEKWMNLLNSNNPVQKSKYLFWKEYGYYIPYSSLSFRLKSLNLNMNVQSLDVK